MDVDELMMFARDWVATIPDDISRNLHMEVLSEKIQGTGLPLTDPGLQASLRYIRTHLNEIVAPCDRYTVTAKVERMPEFIFKEYLNQVAASLLLHVSAIPYDLPCSFDERNLAELDLDIRALSIRGSDYGNDLASLVERVMRGFQEAGAFDHLDAIHLGPDVYLVNVRSALRVLHETNPTVPKVYFSDCEYVSGGGIRASLACQFIDAFNTPELIMLSSDPRTGLRGLYHCPVVLENVRHLNVRVRPSPLDVAWHDDTPDECADWLSRRMPNLETLSIRSFYRSWEEVPKGRWYQSIETIEDMMSGHPSLMKVHVSGIDEGLEVKRRLVKRYFQYDIGTSSHTGFHTYLVGSSANTTATSPLIPLHITVPGVEDE